MKTILLVAETENERTRYLHHLLDGRYQMETAKDAAKAKEQLEERGSEISAVVIDDPYRFARADLVIDHIRTSNTYMLAIPVLILTDEENRSFDELFLCDVVAGLILKGESERVVAHRIEKSIETVNSATFQEFSEMLKALPSLVYLKDNKGRYVFCSKYMHHLEHYNDPEWTIRGKTDLDIRKDKENARRAYESDLRIIETGEGCSYIIEENDDGIHEYLQLIKEPLKDDAGRVRGIIAIINNVTEQEELRKKLRRLSITDELTGLYNRTYYDEFMDNLKEEDYPVTFISADCDGLKSINDLYGHLVGDEYIRMAATMLRNTLGERATVIRTGGDEFLAVLPHTKEDEVTALLDEMKEHEKMFSIRDRTLSVSLGACTMYAETGSFNEYIAASDAEMYRNKKEKKASRDTA